MVRCYVVFREMVDGVNFALLCVFGIFWSIIQLSFFLTSENLHDRKSESNVNFLRRKRSARSVKNAKILKKMLKYVFFFQNRKIPTHIFIINSDF